MAGSDTTSRGPSSQPDLLQLLADRLACLPYPPTRPQLDQLVRYLELLHQWNARFRFSKARTPHDLVSTLLLPSLGLIVVLPEEGAVLDLGSGPGIPGIPIQILRPAIAVTCLESSDPAVEFMRTCAADLPLPNLVMLPGRAESLAHDPDHRGRFDAVVARAFAPLPSVVEIASAFVRPGGNIILQCSAATSSGIAMHDSAMCVLGARFDRVGIISLAPPAGVHIPFVRFHQHCAAARTHPRPWKQMKKRPLWDPGS